MRYTLQNWKWTDKVRGQATVPSLFGAEEMRGISEIPPWGVGKMRGVEQIFTLDWTKDERRKTRPLVLVG